MDSIIEGCRAYRWLSEPIDPALLGVAPTMLSRDEQLMLHWLARELPLGEGACIVDAGAFLGGSTVPLASGNQGRARVYSYDMFVAPRDAYSLGLIGNGRVPGDSVLDLYSSFVAAWRQDLVVTAGDFVRCSPPPVDIGLLFVDIAKNRELNDCIVLNYFPKLIPGRSVLVQQDFNHSSCPYVQLTMFRFKDYFEHLCDDFGSRVFLYTRQIPPQLLRAPLPYPDMLGLYERACANEPNALSKHFMRVAVSWLIFEFEGLGPATAYLSSLELDSGLGEWTAEDVRSVLAAMQSHGDQAGMRRWQETLFSR